MRLQDIDVTGFETLLLDRDGVVNRLRPDDYVKKWEEFEFLPGVLEILKAWNTHFKYIFIDEIQNVIGFEETIESYRSEKNYSIFITGSNSYLLSGELVTKLTGRKIEIEMLPLNFYEYIDMKKFLNIQAKDSIYEEFEQYIREGGFPGALNYNNEQDRKLYVQNILDDIFIKDIKANQKINRP